VGESTKILDTKMDLDRSDDIIKDEDLEKIALK
jgi:hypothetical protein